jgi:hypothetical protein
MTYNIDAPENLKESLKQVVSEAEAYALAKNINKNKDLHAEVKESSVVIKQVLRG